MNARPRIGAFYSKGRNFIDMLRAVRSRYPHGYLCALIPPGYSLSEEETACADEFIETEHPIYSLRRPGPLLTLVRQLRHIGCDVFVIMFDTPKQRLLASFSGADEVWYFDMNRNLTAAPQGIPSVLLGALARNVWGRSVYAAIWVLIRLTRIGNAENR